MMMQYLPKIIPIDRRAISLLFPASRRNQLLPNALKSIVLFHSSKADYDNHSDEDDEPSLSTASTNMLREVPIVYQDNHLLVINKPPGWHSMPNYQEKESKAKCLIYHLIRRKLGGGKNRRFLHPLHRIDQPCSGIMLLGKSSRAGQRLQPLWTLVRKTYCVVVSPRSDEAWKLIQMAQSERKVWRRLIGTMAGKNATKTTHGWSVVMLPGMVAGKGRTVQLDWTLLEHDSDNDGAMTSAQQFVLLIRTTQGARHMVRALLATYGLEILGDTRYGGTPSSTTSSTISSSTRTTGIVPPPLYLPFVALHARSLLLPTIFELGISTLERPRLFTATLPSEWYNIIPLPEEHLAAMEKESTQYPYLIK